MDVVPDLKSPVQQFLQGKFENLVSHGSVEEAVINCDMSVKTIGDHIDKVEIISGVADPVIVPDCGSNVTAADIMPQMGETDLESQNNFLAYDSFKDFEKAFKEYQKETLTTFCTAHNTRDFSKDSKFFCFFCFLTTFIYCFSIDKKIQY